MKFSFGFESNYIRLFNFMDVEVHLEASTILKRLKQKNMTQAALAKEIGISPQYMNDMILGRRLVRFHKALKIHKALS